MRDSFTNEQKQLEKARNPLFLKPSWKETTAVGKALAALKHDTDVTKIEALAKLTEEENARLARLKEDLSKDPSKAAAEQTLKADNVKRLLDAANLVEGKTTDKALAGIASAAADAAAKREAARLAASKAFSGEPLKGVGSEVWRVLWDAARRYSTEIAYSGQAFPPSRRTLVVSFASSLLTRKLATAWPALKNSFRRERQAQEAEIARESARQALVTVVIGTRQLKANLQEVPFRTPI